MAGGISSVVIQIGAQTASAVREIGKVDKALGDTQKTGSKFAGGIQKAAVPAAAALTVMAAAAISATKAAAEDAQSQSKLEGQLKRSAGATDAQVAATEDWISKMSRQAAVTDDEMRPALAKLVTATGDVTEAQGLMKLALDTSAATGKDLSSVSGALAKAHEGSYGALKKLVPTLSDAAIKSGDFAQVQKELNKQVHGAAAEDAGTAAGQYRLMTQQMGELQEKIGSALLPVMEQLTGIMLPMIDFLARHTTVFEIVAGSVAALAASVLIINGALKVYNALQTVWAARTALSTAATAAMTAAQWLLNIALDANPIGLVVLALAALAAGLVLAWHYSGSFRSIVSEAFQYVLKYGWLMLGPLAPFALALKLAWEHSKVFRDVVTGAMDAVRDAIQWIIDKVHELIDLIGKIHIPHIPSIPGINLASSAGGFSAQPLAAGAGAPHINVTISGALDPEQTALAVRNVLERYDRRRGRRPLGSSST